jgi:hypothetical protein
MARCARRFGWQPDDRAASPLSSGTARTLGGAAADSSQPLQQHRQVERFGQPVGQRRIDPALRRFVVGGHQDDRNPRQHGDLELRLAEGAPVHDRHHEVEDDRARVRRGGPQLLERVAPVHGAGGPVAVVGQEVREAFADVLVVLHDQHQGRAHFRRGPLSGPDWPRWGASP